MPYSNRQDYIQYKFLSFDAAVSHIDGDVIVKKSPHQPFQYKSVQSLESRIRKSSKDVLWETRGSRGRLGLRQRQESKDR